MPKTAGGHISPLSISQVEDLLDELASTSGYTHYSIHKKYPQDAGFLAQIILKDLRPIMYPLRETHYAASLLEQNTASVMMLSKEDAMNVWDPSKWMLSSYRVKSTFTETANGFEKPPGERDHNIPKIGVPVAIPKSEKGRGPRNALRYFRNTHQVWAETKYDGERAQIHVEVPSQSSKGGITIFSKSKRDSTKDRKAVHEVIYRAVGLSKGSVDGQSRVRANVILDAEMVVFDGTKIEGRGHPSPSFLYWSIIEETAAGVRKRKHIQSEANYEGFSQASKGTHYSDNLHLGLVFFDILSLNDKSLLMTPYRRRREILESIIQVTPGECILADRIPVGVSGVDHREESQIIALDKVFAESIATHQEGLVLKGDDTKYHDFYTPWVKLKKDYIDGYGDTVDMVVVGVAWERERGRVLRVGPSTMTTFYIGAVVNSEEFNRQPSLQPHLQVYFTVSYGLSPRLWQGYVYTQIIVVNSSLGPQKTSALKYTFSLLQGLAPPKFILKEPLLAELYGAGFTKAQNSKDYELRFPRVTKIYRPNDRPWTEGINLKDLDQMACAVVGRDTSEKEARDITAEIWGKTASPAAKSALRRKASFKFWKDRLASLDGRSVHDGLFPSPSSSPPSSPVRMQTESPAKRPCIGPVETLSDLRPATPSCSPPAPLPQAEKSATQPLGTMTNVLIDPIVVPSSGSRSQSSSVGMLYSPPVTPQKPHKSIQKAHSLSAFTSTRTCPVVAPITSSRFLENSLVWFAKPHGESWSLKSIVPQGQRMHSVEAMLAGCGWCAETQGTPWVEKGIVFVNNGSAAGKDMSHLALKLISERLRELPGGQIRKPIWIFHHEGWTLDKEVENTALDRFE
ncbi:hypothetical protein C0991_000589 [Blastosporella zonata]|nr:hypothetical protein C0991_000589 [Blastosporella zonata]